MSSAPSEGGRVLRAFLNYGLGSYLPQVVSFALTPVYTHYIAPAEMGWVELYVSASTILVIVMRFGLPGAVSRLYFDHGEGQELRDLVTTLAVVLAGLSAAVGLVAWRSGPWLVERLAPGTPIHPYLEITVLTAIFQAAPELQRRLLQVRERSAFSAKLNVVFGITATLLNVLFVLVLDLSALGVLLATLVTVSLSAIVAVYNHRHDLTGRVRWAPMKSAFEYGLPLVPHHTSAWLNQYAGSWVVASTLSTVALGNLSLAVRVVSPMALALSAFSTAYTPVYNSWRKSLAPEVARGHIERVARAAIATAAIMVFGACTVGVWVTRHWMSPAYAAAAPLVGFAALAAFAHLLYLLLACEVFYSKRTKWVSLAFMVGAPTSLALLVLLGPRLGAVAAPVGQAVGALITATIVGGMARATFPVVLPWRAIATAVALGISCALLPRVWPQLDWPADVALNLLVLTTASGLMLAAVGSEMVRDVGRTIQGRLWTKKRKARKA